MVFLDGSDMEIITNCLKLVYSDKFGDSEIRRTPNNRAVMDDLKAMTSVARGKAIIETFNNIINELEECRKRLDKFTIQLPEESEEE